MDSFSSKGAEAGSASVLVVEDERIVAADLAEALTGMGYRVTAIASTGEEAMARAAEETPDLVLMDIRIGGASDGIDVAAALRARFGVPVVYLTAHADPQTVERAKKTEPLGYLVKPIKEGELRSVIEVGLYRHRVETYLRENERWVTTTLRSIGDAVVCVDPELRLTFINPAAETLLARPAAELVGRQVGEVLRLVDDRGQPIEYTPLERALRERVPITVGEVGLMVSRGGGQETLRIITDSAAPVVVDDRSVGAVMVFHDVTEQRTTRVRLELADRLAALGTMAAGVAHEINNPLTIVRMNTNYIVGRLEEQRLELAAAPEEVARLDRLLKALSEMDTAVQRMTSIVADLKAFAHSPRQESSALDVRRAIDWAARSTAHVMRGRARTLFRLDEVPVVQGDEARLGQVFVNLLMNAGQAIEPGNPDANLVSVRTRVDERGWVVAEVRDTGSGITPENLRRIFQPFFTTKPVGEGTGLGLAISHGIVRALGGELLVESAPGEGSVFRVVLPPMRVLQPVAPEPPEPSARGQHGCVLVIDDEDHILAAVKRVLEPEHSVVCVDSAERALELLEKPRRAFDVILCDVTLPRMSGIELYHVLSRTRPEAAGRMVFLIGAMTAAISDFLSSIDDRRSLEKPFSAVELRVVIQQQLRSAKE